VVQGSRDVPRLQLPLGLDEYLAGFTVWLGDGEEEVSPVGALRSCRFTCHEPALRQRRPQLVLQRAKEGCFVYLAVPRHVEHV
jgi:hypothetical protein